ncbi:MAG: MoxR-like ATPase, partial [Myxococcota bacterium]
LRRVGGDHDAQLLLAQAWVEAAVVKASSGTEQDLAPYALEASVLCLTGRSIARVVSQAVMHTTVDGLLGQHANVVGRQMVVRLDELLPRLRRFLDEEVPAYRAYRAFMAKLVQRRRAELRIDEFKPRVLTSFVRNKLINDVYLPLLGDNFAKQMGAVGAGKRTDLMGLLLLISPPGYGKTTLMEYVASRLGLVFMKINGPSLGHAVHSLDPAEAPNATARQEVEKINLALEMGNNVMLYLDDIQHTHPELLQKFISLCDAQRRIEGVWNGETRTYDLRGKKFCVVMAGNPYTESGESFQIPDMLANRADIYNLGDILAGQRETFSLSYLENSLTSNATLAPIATRGQADFYKLVRMAKGDEVPTSDLGHSYSAAELAEIMRVLGHLFRAQEVLLKVNQQYIASASMDDKYRTEPPFKLQGSYRNMNKLSEKIVAALNDVELEAILDDHYVGEAQTLTTGAEANLLKLREMRGVLTDAQAERWADIKQEFVRQRSMGGAEDDPSTRVIGQLSLVVQELDAIRGAVAEAATQSPTSGDPPAGEAFDSLGGQSGLLAPLLLKLHEALEKLRRPQLAVRVEQAPQPEFARFFDAQNRLVQQTLLPVAQAAAKNLEEGSHLTRELIALIERLEAAGARPSPR